ncbi:glycohydrolase toxin TNT-related protein [Spirosoma fluviale]|uniref:glycohydrolase toxin TNT-related protein n=1 Tax=Spirosoma fluviale TaxID=1597977 RepID=UPI000BE3D8AD|nr:glycohydrolase toxin TNT-related protein [Spirosoma fluviale]
MTVNALPTVAITGSLSYCASTSTVLTATPAGAAAYRWSGPGSLTANTAALTVTTVGTYTVVVTHATGCSALTSVTVGQLPQPAQPTVSARVAGTATTQSLTLTATGCDAGHTVRWSGPTSTSATGATWLINAFTQTGTYEARCQSPAGCQSFPAATTATFLSPNTPQVLRQGPGSLCAGQSTTLVTNGCGAEQTVRWSTGQTGAVLVVSPTVPTTYRAFCVSGEVVSEPSLAIDIWVAGAVSIAGATSYTLGQTISLTATVTPAGSVTYTWSGPDSYSSTGAVLQRLGANLGQSGIYTVTARISPTCSVTQSAPVSVTGILTGSPERSVACLGGALSVPFSASGNFGIGNVFSVQLSAPGGSFTAGVTALTASPAGGALSVTLPASLSAGEYRLRVVASNPLTIGVQSPTSLTVSSAPSLTATNSSPSGQTAVGGAVSLSVNGQNLTGATYLWTGPANFSSTVANPTLPTTTTASSGTYTVRVTTPGGCTATAQTSVSLSPVGEPHLCTLVFSGPMATTCISTTYLSGTVVSTTITGGLTVQLASVPPGTIPRLSLFRQTTVVNGVASFALSATATGTSVRFTGLADGTYRLRAYVLTGADTCWASLGGQTSLTATLRCNQSPLNIRIKSVNSQTETDLIPRLGGGLGSLNLSVEELDGQSLAGYTYRWSEPTSTSAVATTATSTTLTSRRIGNYKVTLVSGTDTLVAYTTLRAKPCRTIAQTYQCGTRPAIPVSDTGGLGLSSLAPGDTIRTGDFDLVVTEVQGGSNGVWTGVGYTVIPYMQNDRIAVEFKQASVNDCYEYTGGGTVQSAYDPSWGGVVQTNTGLKQLDVIFSDIKSILADYKNATRKIDDNLTSLKGALDQMTYLSNDLRAKASVQYDSLLTAWNTLKSCNSARAGARLSSTAGDCSISEFEKGLNRLESTLARPEILLPKYIEPGDFLFVTDYPEVDAVSPLGEWVPLRGKDAVLLYTGDQQVKDGLICVQFSDRGSNNIYIWSEEKKNYVDKQNRDFDFPWYYDLLNFGIASVAPVIDLSVGSGWSKLKASYGQYAETGGSIPGFIARMVSTGLAEAVSDVAAGGHRRNRTLATFWMTYSPDLSPSTGGALKGLTKVVGRYGLRLIKATPAEWALLTNLNKEIFRYSVNARLFRLNTSYKRGLVNTVAIYRILDAPVATETGSVKRGIIQLSKDGSGNVFWEFLGNSVLPSARGVSFDEFMKRTPTLIKNAPIEVSQQAFKLWSAERWEALYQLMTQHIKTGIVWPPLDGAIGPIVRKVIREGAVMDRFHFGANQLEDVYLSKSEFVSPLAGNPFTFDERALPPGSYAYYKLRVKPGRSIVVEESPITPWFGKQGKGIQYKFIDPATNKAIGINKLIENGDIEIFDFQPLRPFQ